MNKNILNINSYNCRGLRNNQKRQSIFKWLNSTHHGIILLQECHSIFSDEQKWEREWGGGMYFAHGEFNARGVAILIPKSLNERFVYKNGYKDNNGRFLLMNCEIDNNPFTIINIYSPTKDNVSAQINFLNSIKDKIEEHGDKNIILGGDLNTYLNIEIDKRGGKKDKISQYTQLLKSMCEEYNLVDIWRVCNPTCNTFTHRENTRAGIVQSRLDYFLISEGLTYNIKKTYIKPGLSSDHSLIRLDIELSNTNKRGRGFWKFNNDLLTDKVYINLIRAKIAGKSLHELEFIQFDGFDFSVA